MKTLMDSFRVAIILSLCFMMGVPTFSSAGTVESSKILYLFPLNQEEIQDGQINITNLNGKEVSLNIEAYSRDGVLLENIDSGIISANKTKSVGIETLPEGTESVKVMSDNVVTAAAVFIKADGKSIRIPAVSETSNQFDFFVSDENSVYMKFGLMNPNTVNAGVNIIALDKNGNEVGNNFLATLVPMESSVFSMTDIFDGAILKGLSTLRVKCEESIIIGIQAADYQEFTSKRVSTRTSTRGTGDKASFVSETIPDNTKIEGGKSFSKTWTIKNSGTTTWNSSYKLKYVSNTGGRLSSITQVVSGTVKPGYTYTFTVPMVAPAAQDSDKTYREDWKFTDPSGNTINVGSSSTMWAKIIVPAKASSTPKLTDIAGYSDGVGVSNGKWTGQGPACSNKPGNYYGYYAIESQNSNYYWTIKGSGFGTSKGSVLVSDSSITLTISSWSSSEIKVVPKVQHSYTSKTGVVLTVKNAQNQSASKTISTLGIIKSRGYGQCTWYVACKRLAQGKSIPPSAYTNTASIDANYVPQQWDCLIYTTSAGGKHVGIITSSVTKSEKNGIVTYSFTVGEMNAKCDERESSYSAQFVVDTKNKKITKSISSNAGSTYVATGYYR